MQTLPAYEYGRLAQRWVSAPEPITWSQPVPYSVHAYYDLKAFSLFGIVFPGVKAHFDPFLGVVALSLALLAVTALWRDSRVRLLAALALAAILYALGHNSVFQGALYGLIPQLDKARSPSSAMVLFQFACAALAAFGIDRLATSWTARGTWILTAFGALTLAIAQFVIFANKLTFPADDRVILTAVIALLAAALFAAWRRQALTSTQAHVLLILLLLLELGNSAQYNLADRSDRGADAVARPRSTPTPISPNTFASSPASSAPKLPATPLSQTGAPSTASRCTAAWAPASPSMS